MLGAIDTIIPPIIAPTKKRFTKYTRFNSEPYGRPSNEIINGLKSLNNGKIGNMVVAKEKATNPLLLNGIFFLIKLENHQPMDTAKAPINIPMAAWLTPKYAAPPAAAAAPTVHNGQCAKVDGAKRAMTTIKRGARRVLGLVLIVSPYIVINSVMLPSF